MTIIKKDEKPRTVDVSKTVGRVEILSKPVDVLSKVSGAVKEEKLATVKEEKPSLISRADVLAKASSSIYKITKQKPVAPSFSPLGYVSTSSFSVDMMIGGQPSLDGKGLICPGFPRRRITELYGPESSGKTTMLISAIAKLQKAGGVAMFLDFENALDYTYAKTIGLDFDPSKLLIYNPETMEEGFTQIYIGIIAGVDLIGVDSIAAMVPKDEFTKGFEDPARIGGVAKHLSEKLPKFAQWLRKFPKLPNDKDVTDPDHPGTALVFTNQIRSLIGMQTRGDENTSGGKALKFYLALRLRMARISSEFIERKDPITGKKKRVPYGNLTNVKVVKSKVSPQQGQHQQLFIRYGVGIDDYLTIIESAVTHRLMKKEGSIYVLGDMRFKGKDKIRSYLVSQPDIYEKLKNQLVEVFRSPTKAPTELNPDDEVFEGYEEDDSVDDDAKMSAEEIVTDVENA